MLITKRDGRQVVFDPKKIETAITKAYWEEEYFPTHPLHPQATAIANKIRELDKNMTVEQVQDIVERELMAVDPETAKKYILYRNKRSHAMNATRRKWNVNLQKVKINGRTEYVSARALRTLKKEA